MELFVGVDWAEDHHDLCVMDAAGRVRAKGRVSDDLAGVVRAHDLIASAIPSDIEDEEADRVEVVVGIETDRGLMVRALIAAGYRVLAVNPLSVDRYRDRARVSGAKSDPGDARVLADMVRTDAHQHRPVAADSDLAEAIKLVARSHQSAIWSRRRLANQARSALREFYPAALEAFDDVTHRGRGGGVVDRPDPRAGQTPVTVEDRRRAAPRRPPGQRRPARRGDPGGVTHRAPHPRPRHGRRLRRHRRVARSRSSPRTPARSPSSKRSSRPISASTLTPRSSAASPASESSPAPGCSASSVTTPPATTPRKPAGTTPAPAPSPSPPAPDASCAPATSATGASPTPCTGGPSTPSTAHLAPAPSTTDDEPPATPTQAPSASSPTASSRILHGCLRTRTLYDETTAWAHRADLAA